MDITCETFASGEMMPSVYSCDGEGINPPLAIHDVPEASKSLALIVSDPDAPGQTFVHWVVWGIDPKGAEIPGGAVPPGAKEGLTSMGKTGYVAACPPSRIHHYHFRLFALDAAFPAPKGAVDAAQLEKLMQGHVLASAELVGLYQRE